MALSAFEHLGPIQADLATIMTGIVVILGLGYLGARIARTWQWWWRQ